MGSLYLSTGAPLDEFQIQYMRTLDEPPPTTDLVVATGDVNVPLGWKVTEDGPASVGSSAKLRGLKTAMAARRMTLVPQENVEARTHISRKNDGSGGQIDAFWANQPGRCGAAKVHVDSRHELGTDHERVSMKVLLDPGTLLKRKRGGPRMLIAEPQIREYIDQDALQRMASQCTRPMATKQCPLPMELP